MELFKTVSEARAFSKMARESGKTIALVPTMGALHDGHLRLIEEAAGKADLVLVSIFVNKTQFGPSEDYEAYPRTVDADRELLATQGMAHAIFAPSDSEMYPEPLPKTWVTVDQLTDRLCGASRPGHFRGVTTVVTKLLNICRPDVAVFGLKDIQQFYVIRKLALDLNLDVTIVGVPTVREPDGLAKSSRNKYLSAPERAQAVVLYGAVSKARSLIHAGERDGLKICNAMQAALRKADLGRMDYAELVLVDTFHPVTEVPDSGTVVAAVAMYFGAARLIDNAVIEIERK